MKFLALLILVAACSSGQKKQPRNSDAPVEVSRESFKKERALKNSEIPDYYQAAVASQNPALQDETLDRYSAEEISALADTTDPLVEISFRCSRGDYDRAFQVASKNFNRYQKVAAYWNQVANCHLNQGNHRKALLFYNKALEVKSNYVPALNNIGVMYSRMNQDQKALVAFERANKASKFAKTPRYNLAKLYLTYGLAEPALPIFKGLLGSSPDDQDLLKSVANSYFLLSDYQSASGYFQKMNKALWSRPEVGLNFAVTLKKLGRTEDARKIFSDVEKPKNPGLARYYTSVEKYLGDKL